jgi:cutinase
MRYARIFAVAACGPVIAVFAGTAGAAHAATTSAAVKATTTTTCADVLFVGARGSGEAGPGDIGWKGTKSDPYGMGGPVVSVYNRVKSDFAGDYSMKVESVSYEANGVQTILHAPHEYFNGLSTGVTWTEGILGGMARKCPNQAIILSGYSQGAMVMHRVLHDLGNTASGRKILARVYSALLIGDGDQVPYDNYVRFGSAGKGADGLGHRYVAWSHTSGAKFSKSVGARVLEVCNRYDPVCDSTPNDVNLLYIVIHLEYAGSNALLAAADDAAYSIMDE